VTFALRLPSEPHVAAAITIAGSLSFLVAAFMPISRVFVEPLPTRRLELITASPTAWTVEQVLFGLGAALAGIGLVAAALHLRGTAPAWLVYASAVLLLIGAVLWAWHLYSRAVDPAAWTAGTLPDWPLFGYYLLTPLGFAGIGVALLGGPLPGWVGWLLIASMVVVLGVTLVLWDIPPLPYYIPTLATGVAMQRLAPP
jgi:hypothetical protein